MAEIAYLVSTWLFPVLVAITLHEAAHGYVAWQLGDSTAKLQGRVTFNPLKHIDPVGTLLLPGLLILIRAPFLFGFAKPVPINFMKLRNPRRDMVLVALPRNCASKNKGNSVGWVLPHPPFRFAQIERGVGVAGRPPTHPHHLS